ncbi:MAG: NADH-quinone oxidoreductase subunit NuoG [Magnetococcales bacterium]|nr:NADH-quinone oxidoreductase subunit NuoG [Magnetococcales bacterium]
MPTLIIDGKEVSVKPGTTIMEAARQLGIKIPHFCYHRKLSIAGNCRICLVEVEKMPKPVVSCAMPVADGMVVRTDSDMVRKGRKGVMEFLLINHPLDCPVCDQGGECKLQDLAMRYGPDRARFHETKREVPNWDLGALIETEMNRCIHCTRCIRFSQEVAGVEEMGGAFRGDHMRVGTYVQKTLSSELSGNLAQICPVGALNDKPFHFQARGWELKQTFGICTHCSVGCHLRRDHLDNTVRRVVAESCEAVNQSWICDKGRFSYDGMGADRILRPMIRRENKGHLEPVSWQEALDFVARLLKEVRPEEVAGLASASQCAESLFSFQDFLRHSVGTPHIDHRVRQRDFSGDQAGLTRADLLMNTPLADLAKADAILLLGIDPRQEVPLLNLRLRQAAQAGARIMAVNPRRLDHNLPGLTETLLRPGAEVAFLTELLALLKGGAEGSEETRLLAATLSQAKFPLVMLGDYSFSHPEAEAIRRLAVAILEACGGLRPEWNGFNRVYSRANSAAAQDLGVVPHRGPGYRRSDKVGKNGQQILEAAANGEIKVLFLLGLDPRTDCADTRLASRALDRAKVIFLGTHHTPGGAWSTVALPGLASAEKETTYTNCEGRVQRGKRAVNGPLEAKEDWRILRALSDRFPVPLAYNALEALRKAMADADHRYNQDHWDDAIMSSPCNHRPVTTGLPVAPADQAAREGLLLVVEPAFYRDDAITRHSAVMSRLDHGQTVRVNPEEGESLGLRQGGRARLIHEEQTVEVEICLDARVPRGLVFGRYGDVNGLIQDLGDWHGGFPAVSLVGL